MPPIPQLKDHRIARSCGIATCALQPYSKLCYLSVKWERKKSNWVPAAQEVTQQSILPHSITSCHNWMPLIWYFFFFFFSPSCLWYIWLACSVLILRNHDTGMPHISLTVLQQHKQHQQNRAISLIILFSEYIPDSIRYFSASVWDDEN